MNDDSIQANPAKPTKNMSDLLFRTGLCLALAWLGWTQYRLGDDIEALHAEIATRAQSTARAEEKLAVQMDNQASLLGRAIGEVIPIRLPTDIQANWDRIESKLNDPTQWPAASSDLRNLKSEIDSLIRSIPPWAEPDFRERLQDLHWGTVALGYLKDPENPSWESLTVLADQGHELVANAPNGKFKGLRDLTEQRADKYSESARQMLFKRAKELADTPADPEEMASVLYSMEATKRDAEQDRLASRLGVQILKHQHTEYSDGLRLRFEKALQLRASDPVLFEQVLQSLLSEAMHARTTLASMGEKLPPLDKEFDKINLAALEITKNATKQSLARQSSAIHNYQRWAIERIKQFDVELQRARHIASDRGLIGSKWTSGEYTIIGEALVRYLLDIDTNLLEIPVRDRFFRSYNEGWSQLDKAPHHQAYVLEKSASIDKTPLIPADGTVK